MSENLIYFDNNKEAYNTPIIDYIATCSQSLWFYYSQPENMDKWDIVNSEFKDITDTQEYIDKKILELENEFNKNFFPISLKYNEDVEVTALVDNEETTSIETQEKIMNCYIKRSVYIKNTEKTTDFLDSSVSRIESSITETGLIQGAFIYYLKPDFESGNIKLENHPSPALTKSQAVDFIGQCNRQYALDFGAING